MTITGRQDRPLGNVVLGTVSAHPAATVTASGIPAGLRLVTSNSGQVSLTGTPTAAGTSSTTVTVCNNAAATPSTKTCVPLTYTIVISQAKDGTPSRDLDRTLPRTGTDTAGLAVLAFAMVCVGAIVVSVRYRRTRRA